VDESMEWDEGSTLNTPAKKAISDSEDTPYRPVAKPCDQREPMSQPDRKQNSNQSLGSKAERRKSGEKMEETAQSTLLHKLFPVVSYCGTTTLQGKCLLS